MSVQQKVDNQMIGASSDSTKRIILISSQPSSLHELVRELTAHRYDIMVFHHMNPHLLNQMHPDALILDRRNLEFESEMNEILSEVSIPTIHFMLTRFITSTNDNRNLYMQWPAPALQIVSNLKQLIAGHDHPSENQTRKASFKDLVLDYRRMTVNQADTRIELTRTEFGLLKVLLEADGAVLTRQEILDDVWGEDYFGGSNIVDVHIKRLRNKLNDDPKLPKYIATIRSIGYRLAD